MAGNQKNVRVTRRGLLVAGGGVIGAGALATVISKSSATNIDPVPSSDASMGIPVAFVMDHGATMIDFAGPWEVFQDVGDFHLYAVAKTTEELQTTGNMSGNKMSGLRYRADYLFDNAPQPKIVVMGAQTGSTDPVKIAWIRKVAANADVVMSVCTGAFLLAETGLLDGLEATTHHDSYDRFAKRFPKVTLVRGRRFVDNGKLITAGGLTSGIDAALHVVSRYQGVKAAEGLANYMEHFSPDWKTGASLAA